MAADNTVPGLDVIAAVASLVGMPMTETFAKAQQMFAAQPDVIRASAQQRSELHARVAANVDDTRVAGLDAQQSFAGEAANTFADRHGQLLAQLSQSHQAADQVVSHLNEVAAHVAGQQHGVTVVTAAVAAQLRMMLAAGIGGA